VEQAIRFLPWQGRRLAFATSGAGAPIVVPGWWVSHLELYWHDRSFRQFFEAVARGRMLVRYDRLGVGLSDRRLEPNELSLEHDVETLAAVLDHLELERCVLLGGSSAGTTAAAFAARHPERVEALVLYGTYESGAAIATPEFAHSLVSLVRAHWGAGSRLLASVFVPEGTEAEARDYARFQREAATAEAAAAMLELVYALDVRAELPAITTPTLVVHRRGDTAVPYERGREVASRIPGARLVPLAGKEHFPWRGDSHSVIRAVGAFLDGPPGYDDAPAPAPDGSALSRRERDVLALVAAGLTDREIATQLVVSPHTVHRHIANIRRKLGQSTRAAAATEAARLGLI
jgi:pimeloyl-ACP methyl ester carboxylesterase/DNA-binding CsgD family transcriptional regulator